MVPQKCPHANPKACEHVILHGKEELSLQIEPKLLITDLRKETGVHNVITEVLKSGRGRQKVSERCSMR